MREVYGSPPRQRVRLALARSQALAESERLGDTTDCRPSRAQFPKSEYVSAIQAAV